jgi:hypothetical protein
VNLVGIAGIAAARQRFGSDVRILPARYEISQLADWRDRLRSVLSLPSAVFLDLDERSNRVVIGIDRASTATQRASFELAVAERQVPVDAVIVEDTDPIIPLQTLRDRVTPTPGGVQINFDIFLCTLGFNVSFEGGQGFVTCSHCTQVPGGEEGTTYTQGGVGIGVEERDPLLWTGGVCPTSRRCRYSDSALISYAYAQENGAFNKIAKVDNTGACESSANSLTIDSTKPQFRVVSTQDVPYVGQAVEKIGRTSGWTTGTVTSTCVDANVGTTDITRLCQDFATVGALGGDSGSPVFHENVNGDVIVDGVLWGSNGSCVAVFSHVSSIVYEIGPITIDAF